MGHVSYGSAKTIEKFVEICNMIGKALERECLKNLDSMGHSAKTR
jgi:hypothetical protein